MSRSLTASDRSARIRLASTLPKGSPERRAILSGLQTRYLDSTGHPVDFNISRIVERYTINWAYEALKKIPGFKPDGSSLNYGASGWLTDGSILPSWTEGTDPPAVIGVRTGYLGGHVYIQGMHGYGEALTRPSVSTDFKVFTRDYGSSPNDRTQTEPVEDPVQTIYDAIQETLKKFRKVKVTPLDPLKWQKYEGSRHLHYSVWGDILRRSQTVLEKEEAPKGKYTTVEVVRVWRWDKKDGHVWYTVERRGFGGMLDQSFNQSVFYRSPQAYDSLSKAKAAAKAHARRRTASKNVVASSPTALAKVVRSTPGLESLSDRDSMAVAKGLIGFLLKKLKWLLDDELDDAFDNAESDYEEGEYETVVYSGGGPSRFGPDGDEDYYDITEERSFDYAAKVRAPFNLWFRLDDALAEINGISPLAEEAVDGNAKALFGALAWSRLMESIVKDAIKNQWRTWFKKEVAEYAAEVAEADTDEYLDSSLRVMQPPPYNLGYNLKTVTLDSDSKIHIELDVLAAFNEPEIEER